MSMLWIQSNQKAEIVKLDKMEKAKNQLYAVTLNK